MSFSYKIDRELFDIVPAEVVGVNYKDTNKNNLYSVKVKLLHRDSGQNPSDVLSARPLNSNIKHIPLIGEVVVLLKGPTSYGAGLTETTENYYISTFSVQNSTHHNAIPKRHLTKNNNQSYGGVSPDFPENNNEKHKLSNSFSELNNIRPLQPYAGDLLIESRNGSSIRFGSSLIDFSDYNKDTSWKQADGKTGDPITILRNGQRSDIGGINEYIIEDIDKDNSSIYLTSTQQLKFTPASSLTTSIVNKGLDSFKNSPKFSGKQIGIFSDRVIVNARKNEVVMFSKKGFGFSTPNNTSFDVGDTFEVNAKSRINLGYLGDEPALMGDTSGDWLQELLTELVTLCTNLSSEVHGTGTGPTTPPLNAASYISSSSKFQELIARIPTLKSELVFLNKR
jgi:hypothetical protein